MDTYENQSRNFRKEENKTRGETNESTENTHRRSKREVIAIKQLCQTKERKE